MALEDALLAILVCPIDKHGLLYFADDAVLYNPRLRRLYRIEAGIPLMLPRQAMPVPDEEHSRLMKCARRGEVTTMTAGQDDVLADSELARQPVHGQPGLGRPLLSIEARMAGCFLRRNLAEYSPYGASM